MAKKLHFNLGQPSYTVTFRLGFTVLCIFFVSLFSILGAWQVSRYESKKTLLAGYEQQRESIPQAFDPNTAPKPFQRVIVQGRYLNNRVMLIQNRVYHDQMGAEVLTPVEIQGTNKLLLVNRGWIPVEKISSIPFSTEEQFITGSIKLLNDHTFILGKNIYHPDAQPLIMQRIEIKELEKITKRSYYPFILRLDPKEPNGFVRDWVISTSTPERHLGYAIQWFLMAFVLAIAYFCFCSERIHKRNK